MIQTVVVTLLAVLAAANVGTILWTERNRYGFVWRVWRRFRLGMLLVTFGVFVITVVVAVSLTLIPGLGYGWMHLFYAKGGNVLIEPVLAGSRSSIDWVRFVPVAFLAVFIFVMPFIARLEEEMFRKGHTDWPTIMRRSLGFGLMHCVVGIPVAFGLALSLAGLFYAYQYKTAYERFLQAHPRMFGAAEEEGLMVSTTYHTLWNTIACSLLLAFTLSAALQ